MTLSKFKTRLKISAVAIFVAFYGLSFYSLGRNATDSDLLKVKGATTKQEEEKSVDKPLPYADVQSAKVIAGSVKLCSNTKSGFEISYPMNWFTTYNKEDEKCSYFAPYSFVVPEFVDKEFVPIEAKTFSLEEWESTVKFFDNPNEFLNVISAQNIEIEGKMVHKVESSSTGSGSQPRGFVQVVYLVFDSRAPLEIKYKQLDAKDDVESMKKTLEEMVRSVKYF